jgi:hypothetical protein
MPSLVSRLRTFRSTGVKTARDPDFRGGVSRHSRRNFERVELVCKAAFRRHLDTPARRYAVEPPMRADQGVPQRITSVGSRPLDISS